MDFYVYDNIYTYNKHNPFNGVVVSRLVIDSIDIPENHSFWFHTNMEHLQNNVNLNKRYVHIHPGVGTTNQVRFDKEPYHVNRGNINYNPKKKMVEIGGGLFRKPVFAKRCIYYGSALPSKKMSIVGEWFYNFSNESIIFIIDYNPQKIKFHWEDTMDEPSMAEVKTKEAKLELEIEAKERKKLISQRSSAPVSDPV